MTSTQVLEEIIFKLLIAKASEIMQTKNVWKIRERLKKTRKSVKNAYNILVKFLEYIKILCLKGLTVMQVYPEEAFQIPRIFRETGLLTSDCLHIAKMKRLNLKKIATLDQDFRKVKGLTIIP